MKPPDGFVLVDTHALYRPAERRLAVDELTDLCYEATRYAHDQGCTRLMLDISSLSFGIPSMSDRFEFAQRLAGAARAVVKVVVVCAPEVIDILGFGVSVARNRGLTAERISEHERALAWLLDDDTG